MSEAEFKALTLFLLEQSLLNDYQQPDKRQPGHGLGTRNAASTWRGFEVLLSPETGSIMLKPLTSQQ